MFKLADLFSFILQFLAVVFVIIVSVTPGFTLITVFDVITVTLFVFALPFIESLTGFEYFWVAFCKYPFFVLPHTLCI